MKTIATLLNQGYQKLTGARVPDPLLDAQYLLGELMGLSRLELVLMGGTPVPQDIESCYDAWLQRRAEREPLQYILGFQPFLGLNIRTDTRALIPRPETELLCEKAIALVQGIHCPRVLDLCAGTGVIGLAIKKHVPQADVSLTDLCRDALALAGENAAAHSLAVTFHQGDLFAPLSGQTFHLIVSNPPYIPLEVCGELDAEVKKEPLIALDGGVDGLDFYRRIADESPLYLEPGGLLLLEIGFDQGESVKKLLEQNFTQVQVIKDYSQLDRMVQAKKR